MRGAQAEGQIKGAARRAARRQSARGFAAAPRGGLRVPRRGRIPQRRGRCRVLFTLPCATLCCRPRRGQPG